VCFYDRIDFSIGRLTRVGGCPVNSSTLKTRCSIPVEHVPLCNAVQDPSLAAIWLEVVLSNNSPAIYANALWPERILRGLSGRHIRKFRYTASFSSLEHYYYSPYAQFLLTLKLQFCTLRLIAYIWRYQCLLSLLQLQDE
jgi:hypothetical protein